MDTGLPKSYPHSYKGLIAFIYIFIVARVSAGMEKESPKGKSVQGDVVRQKGRIW